MCSFSVVSFVINLFVVAVFANVREFLCRQSFIHLLSSLSLLHASPKRRQAILDLGVFPLSNILIQNFKGFLWARALWYQVQLPRHCLHWWHWPSLLGLYAELYLCIPEYTHPLALTIVYIYLYSSPCILIAQPLRGSLSLPLPSHF